MTMIRAYMMGDGGRKEEALRGERMGNQADLGVVVFIMYAVYCMTCINLYRGNFI